MNTLTSLVSRHNKLFRRDRMLVLFSLLTVLIVIILYAVFLQKMQVDAIEQLVPASAALKTMVNEWMVAGLLSIISVTTTLAAYGIYIKDVETKVLNDFLTAPLTRAQLHLSYVANALAIGFFLSVIGLVCCQLFLVAMGGDWFSLEKWGLLIAIILLSVTLSSALNLFFTLLVTTQSAFSTLSTIIGTSIGFLCGVYVPLGSLPDLVQKAIMLFPVSHTAVLYREVLMHDSIDAVFAGNPEAANSYEVHFGVHYEWGETVISLSHSLLFIAASVLVFTVISLWLYARRQPHS
ncbi:MAG: ABC transporter permease [Lysinibacillus sp.]